ncbi:DUF5708 family protein [Streptomyces sp. NPDC053474]|uniref:DUF5708 family protein n=1 Tax=Streptomyces sp. NPDC053474 TaxID=3365704 RepID=UPI0037D6D38C
MNRATKDLAEGSATFAVGLALKLFTGGVELPVVTLTKVGVVLMAIGAALALTGLVRTVRATSTRPPA